MLEKIFRPEGVAVIGATREPGKVGHNVVKNLLNFRFPKKIFPINPKAQEILGLKVYPSVLQVPDKIDLAIIAVKAALVPKVLEDCGQKGIVGAVILSAGFKEAGRQGAKLEQEIIKIASQYNIRIIGPNCLGIVDTYARLNATFAAIKPLKGKIGFFSQSGALCLAILEWSKEEKIGLSRFVSLGNKADLSEIECLRLLGEDPHTKVIMGYLEGIDNGRAFTEVAQEIAQKKPIIIFKSGITAAGARAASSHTGSLAGSEVAFKAAVKKAGIIRSKNLREFFNLGLFFASQPLMKGPKIAILTNSGGPGIIAADTCELTSLELPTLGAETVNKLRSVLPSYAAFYNPVDITGDANAKRYEQALKILLEDPHIHGILIILSRTATVDPYEVAHIINKQKGKKPLSTCFLGYESVKKARKFLLQKKIPSFEYPEEGVSVLEKAWIYNFRREKPYKTCSYVNKGFKKALDLLRNIREEGRHNLLDHEVKQILEAYGFRFPKALMARTTEEAILAAQVIGYPVVLKILSPQIQHKTDVGGVRVNIKNQEELIQAFQEITMRVRSALRGVNILGMLVQEMVPQGKEIIIGFSRDPQFGPLIMFGLGGIYVEVIKDVSFRLAPVCPEEALEMIREVKAYRLLKGIRGEPEADIEALVKNIVSLGQLAADFPELSEGEINPLLVRPKGKGTIAVDARLSLGGEK